MDSGQASLGPGMEGMALLRLEKHQKGTPRKP